MVPVGDTALMVTNTFICLFIYSFIRLIALVRYWMWLNCGGGTRDIFGTYVV